MIKGVAVTVMFPTYGDADRFGNAQVSYEDEDCQTVPNVLVAPGTTTDLEAARPEGAQVYYTLHFPKSFTGDLEGCKVVLPPPWSGTYDVLGIPGKYIDADTPTAWDMPVQVGLAHG